jgi:hypothetical protein
MHSTNFNIKSHPYGHLNLLSFEGDRQSPHPTKYEIILVYDTSLSNTCSWCVIEKELLKIGIEGQRILVQ